MERGDRTIENMCYYEKHRDRLLAEKAKRIHCACCIWHAKSNTARHMRSQRHIDRVKAGKVIARFIQTVLE